MTNDELAEVVQRQAYEIKQLKQHNAIIREIAKGDPTDAQAYLLGWISVRVRMIQDANE